MKSEFGSVLDVEKLLHKERRKERLEVEEVPDINGCNCQRIEMYLKWNSK